MLVFSFQSVDSRFWACKLCPALSIPSGTLKRHSLRYHLIQQHSSYLKRSWIAHVWRDEIVPLEGPQLTLQTKRAYLHHANKQERYDIYADLHRRL